MISGFFKEYFFLSNFYETKLRFEGISFSSSEAAFQAAKTLDLEERRKIAKMSPSESKKAGRAVALRSDWESIKDKVMYDVCLAKFRGNESLGKRLIATGDEELVEENTWHDNYWGNCTCEKCKDIRGKNQLGKTLMQVRSNIRTGGSKDE